MKITSFNPLIVTKDAEALITLFEELGFERKHKLVGTLQNGANLTSIRMKDANGFHVDIAETSDNTKDISLIRMNVDNFDEAYEMLKAKGFHNARPDEDTFDTKSNRSAMMISPTGFAFDLCQHIKDHD